MLVEQINIWILYFFIYAVLGWFCETIYCSVGSKKLVARGFLYGPYCPIYGFGAVILLRLLEPFHNSPILMFFVGMIACSALEYLTSWVMEKLFHMRWWDYSKKKFNLNGRICLKNSILFGLGGMVIVYLVHPVISKEVNHFTPQRIELLASLVIAVMLIDFISSLASTLKLSSVLKEAQDAIEKFKEEHPGIPLSEGKIAASLREVLEKAGEGKEEVTNSVNELLDKLKEISPTKLRSQRLQDQTSTARLVGDGDALEIWRSYAKEQLEDWKEERTVHKETLQQERKEAKENNKFAAGISFNKVFWIFMICSVLGYIIEVLFSYATKGEAQSCQGLLYGPISQVYGLGAVVLTLSLYKYTKPEERDKNNNLEIFITGGIVGGAFEVLCSWIEELAFGFISWYYPPSSLGIINGRTSIIFMFFWGLLGVVFIKKIYPVMSDLIEKTPRKAGRIITLVVFILMMVDVILTIGAVYRYSRRADHIPAETSIGQWMDEAYPNERMREIFPGMEKGDDKKALAAGMS